MARPAPGHLPKILPDLDASAKLIEHWANAPRMRLGDLSIRQLVETYGDGSPVWLTGSTVWMPAVFSLPPPNDNDADLIFASEQACDRFVTHVMAELNRRCPGFKFMKDRSRLGAARIVFPSKPKTEAVRHNSLFGRIAESTPAKTDGVIDAWSLAPGQSVAEILMAYESDYQRCAYLMNRSIAGSGGAITRIVRPVKPTVFRSGYW